MVRAEVPPDRSPAKTAKYDHGGAGGYILSGLLLFGGLGMWLDHLLGLSLLTPFGLVLGAVVGGFLVYVRVVREPAGPAGADGSPDGDRDRSRSAVERGDTSC